MVPPKPAGSCPPSLSDPGCPAWARAQCRSSMAGGHLSCVLPSMPICHPLPPQCSRPLGPLGHLSSGGPSHLPSKCIPEPLQGLSLAGWLSWQVRGLLPTHGIQLVHLLLLWDFHGGRQDLIPFELLVELLQSLSGLSVCIFQIIRWILFGLFFIYKTALWPWAAEPQELSPDVCDGDKRPKPAATAEALGPGHRPSLHHSDTFVVATNSRRHMWRERVREQA